MSPDQQKKRTDKIIHQEGEVAFTSEEFKAIAGNYGLGKIIGSPEVEKGGFSNYLFTMKTDTGTYMIRARADDLSPWRKQQRELEYAVTDYLAEQQFPYNIPQFLVNQEGERLAFVDGKIFDVYKRLPGTSDYERRIQSDLIKAVACYHKTMADFPQTRPNYVGKGPEWLHDQLLTIEKQVKEPKNDLDRLMSRHIDFLKEMYALARERARTHAPDIIIHGDLQSSNVLYGVDRVSGIIDFENVEWGKKEQDLVKITTGEPRDVAALVSEYRKHYSLSDQEVTNIVPEKTLQEIIDIWWIFSRMKKHPEFKGRSLEKKLKNLQDLKKITVNSI